MESDREFLERIERSAARASALAGSWALTLDRDDLKPLLAMASKGMAAEGLVEAIKLHIRTNHEPGLLEALAAYAEAIKGIT